MHVCEAAWLWSDGRLSDTAMIWSRCDCNCGKLRVVGSAYVAVSGMCMYVYVCVAGCGCVCVASKLQSQ